MSQPAHALPEPAPDDRPLHGAAVPVPRRAPQTRPAGKPPRPQAPLRRKTPVRHQTEPLRETPRPRAAPKPTARRRGSVGFLVLFAIVVGSMVLGLVSLSALLAESSFRADDLQHRIDALAQENLDLTREQAALSAPGRIDAWARRSGMRLPDDIRFLHVPGEAQTAPAGGADALARTERPLKPVVGGSG